MKYILTLITFLLTYNSYTQSVCKLSQEELDIYLCLNDYTSIQSSASLTENLRDIMSEIGLSQSNFTIKTCNSINNAAAIIYEGERELLIDERYLSQINNSSNKSFNIFVLAHEIGHHLNGHTLKISDNITSRQQELEADYFAGFVIKKLSGGIQDISKSLKNLPHPKENIGTHPILQDRILSAENGFKDAEQKEQKILGKFEEIITQKIKNTEKSEVLNLARSFYYKFAKTGNVEFFKSSRRYYEELINKQLYKNVPFIELSYLHKLNNDTKSSIKILNEIVDPNSYTALLLWEDYNHLKQPIPNKIEYILNEIDATTIQGLTYQTILANYYLNKNDVKQTEIIFANSLIAIQESADDNKDEFELVHFYSNYSYFLNSQSKFKQSVDIAQKAIDLAKSSEYLRNEQVRTILKASYANFSVALLGSQNYIVLKNSLSEWRKLGLNEIEINSDILYLTARLEEETGNSKKAITSFQSYLNFNVDPFANFHLGKCYLESNNKKAACIEFETSCENGVELACRYLKVKCDD